MAPSRTIHPFAVTAALISMAAIAGCQTVDPLVDYRPVVDSYTTDMTAYEIDLDECINLALRVEAEYKRKQEAERQKNIVTGIVSGLVLGAALGSDDGNAGSGAALGAASGASIGAASDTAHSDDLIKYGPRRVVDRCMKGRGYKVLSDLGIGG